MKYTVLNVKEFFAEKNIEVKQGTIETYRSKLQEVGILRANESLTEKQVDTLEKILEEKTEDISWDKIMMKYIYTDFRHEMKIDFEWSIKLIVRHLLYSIQGNYYEVSPMYILQNLEDYHALECFIDNFVELGYKYKAFQNSKRTDPNGFNYKIKTLDGSIYYVIGKYNFYTQKEDCHLFFCKTSHFNIMQCNYIGAWNFNDDDEIFKKFEKILLNANKTT